MTRAQAMRVLIVDDDGDLRMGLAGLLRAYGYDVDEADCGERALQRTHTSPPDAAIIDLELDDAALDGYELARKLRGSPKTARLRLISLTGHRGAEERARALSAGFDAHLVKPVGEVELFAALSSGGT